MLVMQKVNRNRLFNNHLVAYKHMAPLNIIYLSVLNSYYNSVLCLEII